MLLHAGYACPAFGTHIATDSRGPELCVSCLACSYYPMYPPAAGAMLDTSLASNLQLPVIPDILLLPSDLNPFAKLTTVPAAPQAAELTAATSATSSTNVRVVCVNPGRLTKGTGGGTFSTFHVGPYQVGSAADSATAPANYAKTAQDMGARCKVTISRV